MSDVLVCAEPDAREEATKLVSKLGARPLVWTAGRLKRWRQEKVKGLVVYFDESFDPSVLRSCLKQASANHLLPLVVFSHHWTNRQAAEVGKIVGELRPHKTEICFDWQEVQKIFRGEMRVSVREEKTTPLESFASLREELSLTQVDVAHAFDVSPRTVQNWESRGNVPERPYRDLKELHSLVTRYMESRDVMKWMDAPNEAFGKDTPRQWIREGKIRDLILEFGRLETGEPL
jgi:DNA-binding XRE family transcriptional regulator